VNLAVYHPWLKEKGGAEKVVLEIAKRSRHDITVYTLYYSEEDTFSGFQDVEVVELGNGSRPESFLENILYGLKSLTADIPTEQHDKLLISEAGLGSLISLRNNGLPVYCYCHTPLRAALPEFRETYREEISTLMKPVFDLGVKVYSFLEKRAWKHFEKVAANSETTKERVIEKGLADHEDIEVVNPGADVDNPQGDYRKYFLYPSRFRRYKRQDLAIEAFKQAELEGFNLVLAGSAQEEEYVEELEKKAEGSEDIEVKTDLPGEEWQELYRNSYAVLFLAEKEDWGIIPVEAGSYGKPVIAVNEGGPTESVIDGETGFLVEPSKEEIGRKMRELAEDRERTKTMGERGLENAQKYSWQNFTEKMDEMIE